MKSKNIIKNIVSFIIFIVMIILFIYFGTREYDVKIADNVKFANEYKDISKNNIFVYTKGHEVLDLLNNDGILFLGFASNIWSHYYAEYLNEVAIENQISKINYYDFKKDRELNNAVYLNIVNKLKDHLYVSDTDNIDLTAPTIIIVKNGQILYFDATTNQITANIKPTDYFNDYKINLLKTNLNHAIKQYLGEDEL